MLRRYLAAALLILIALVLLVVCWPQLFGLQRTPGVAQLVSFRAIVLVLLCIGALLLLFTAVVSPRLRRFTASLAAILVAAAALQGVVLASRGAESIPFQSPTASTIAVMAWNTLGDVPGADAIAQLALDSDADVVALAETTVETGNAVADAMGLAGHPMQSFTVHFDLISKARSTTLLISDALGEYVVDPTEPSSSVLPSVIARPADGTGPTIVSVHLVAPIPGELAHWESDLQWMAETCRGSDIIIAGDFNATLDHFTGLGAGSATLGDCIDAASVSDSAAMGTWPTQLPALFGAPIDHVMATSNWTVTGIRVIENRDGHGSDHRPVLVQLTPAG